MILRFHLSRGRGTGEGFKSPRPTPMGMGARAVYIRFPFLYSSTENKVKSVFFAGTPGQSETTAIYVAHNNNNNQQNQQTDPQNPHRDNENMRITALFMTQLPPMPALVRTSPELQNQPPSSSQPAKRTEQTIQTHNEPSALDWPHAVATNRV